MAYVALSANGAKGIAKFFSEEKMAELKNMFGVKDGDAVVFMGGNRNLSANLQEKVRTKLGEELDLIEKARSVSAGLSIFRFMKKTKKPALLNFRIIRSRCRRAEWMH